MIRPKVEEFSVSQIPDCPATAKWYCVVVRPSWSQRVSAELYAMGHRTFTPSGKRWRSQQKRFTAVERPISGMSSYLFVEIDYPRQSFRAVRDTRGVIEIIPEPVSRKTETVDPQTGEVTEKFQQNAYTDFLMRQLKGEWDEIASESKYPIGAVIAVVEGPHENKKAVVTQIKGKKIFAKVEGMAQISTFFAPNVRAA